MAKRKQTIQWLKENREYNSKKKTDNTMAKRKQTLQRKQTLHRKQNNTQKTKHYTENKTLHRK